jgi:Kef-type K+ transport system membrane component KefB
VTIIGAAVLDDVLGIIALAIVAGIAATGTVSAGSIGLIACRALGFWIVLTLVVFALAKPIERVLMRIKYSGAVVGLGLAIAFIGSGAAETFGLAFIIGAYSVGLGLSQTKLAHQLMDELNPISDFTVPIFFAALGMLVDFNAMLSDRSVIFFGLIVTAAAIVGKLVGCGLAANWTGFNLRGSYRIGLGMMPRGEVALIIAGIGLSTQMVGKNVFGVSIMMTLITTVLAPILLVPAFKGGSGRKRGEEKPRLPTDSALPGLKIQVPLDMGELMLNRLLNLASHAGWVSTLDNAAEETYLLRSGGDAAQVRLADGELLINASDRRQGEFDQLLAEVKRSVVSDSSNVNVRSERSDTSH